MEGKEMEYPQSVGFRKWLVKCVKCGYIWTARDAHPKRCALCHNLNPEQPYKYNSQLYGKRK